MALETLSKKPFNFIPARQKLDQQRRIRGGEVEKMASEKIFMSMPAPTAEAVGRVASTT